jgi:endonuclease/exonuclease/phosphatase (EEP) superfamily protein YafD
LIGLLRLVLLAVTAVLALGTVLPVVRKPYWWIRSFDFPRLQIAALALGALAALAAVSRARGPEPLDGWALATLAAVVAFQTARMLPYSPLWRVQTVRAEAPDRDRSLRLVVSNVLMTNRDGARWLRTIRAEDPDVVAAVETDAWWAETAGALRETHPHTVLLPQDDTYGMCVFSRLPIVEHTVEHLVEPEVPSLFLTLRLPSGEPLHLVVLHPRPPRPDVGQDSTLRDAELVLAARRVARMGPPVVVCGDLNDVAWSETTTLFQRIAGVLDPRVGRGLFSTFHANHRLLRYPLDHVFHTPDLALVRLARLGHVGSDHFPMAIELALCARAEAEQDAPEETPDARVHAAEVVEEVQEFKAAETPKDAAERKAQDV